MDHLSLKLVSRSKENGRHFRDDIFKHIFVNETVRILVHSINLTDFCFEAIDLKYWNIAESWK